MTENMIFDMKYVQLNYTNAYFSCVHTAPNRFRVKSNLHTNKDLHKYNPILYSAAIACHLGKFRLWKSGMRCIFNEVL